MRARYSDLLALFAATPPLWYDENGVPRWAAFQPLLRADVYATELALVRVACGCGKEVDLAISSRAPVLGGATLGAQIRAGRLLPIEAPALDCCDAGPMRYVEPLRVLQFWRLGEIGLPSAWCREGALEREVERMPAPEPDDVTADGCGELVVTIREAWLAGVRAERGRASTCAGCLDALLEPEHAPVCEACSIRIGGEGADPPDVPTPEAMLAAWVGEIDAEAAGAAVCIATAVPS